MTHRVLLTNAGHVVTHSHYTPDLDPAMKQALQADTLSDPQYPGLQPVVYVHLDGTHEELWPTKSYNCWGFTFNPRQCWLGPVVQTILNDNGIPVYPPNLRLGDVICYRNNGSITHTGRIVALGPTGEPALVQSKWGQLGEYIHQPQIVPVSYGTDRTYYRVQPLCGKGDAWMADNAADDRLPCAPGTHCASPDLWVNSHGGTYCEDPIGGQPNNIYVRVHNPDTLPIANALIRVYWCDPNTGIGHDGWHPIGTIPANVAPSTEGVLGPLAWTPDAAVPDHACLFAIADTGDDPRAAATLDPIVWPYDSVFDNNIVWHNLTVSWLNLHEDHFELTWIAQNPLPTPAPIELVTTIKRIGPKEMRALNLDPKIARKVTAPARDPQPRTKARALPPLRTRFQIDAKEWARSGNPFTARGWRLKASQVNPGEGARVSLRLYPTALSQPGQAYHVYIEQTAASRVTGALNSVVVIRG